MNTLPRQGVVNIVNFIRGIEPREPVDLLEPVKQQMALARQHDLPVTWLVQYDAMCDPNFQALLKDIRQTDEIGIWVEFVQPLVEKAGLEWRGRAAWDWLVNVGFSVGYSVTDRKKLIDVFIEDFRSVFGFTPKSAGSWFVDAQTLEHLSVAYGIKAFCNCKDQWGTDGYTLWGGYYNQAYYPSRKNSYIPAQSSDLQIDVPVFRMLGSDPINQYGASCDGSGHGQIVLTLEPVSPQGGGNPQWVDRFFNNMFETPCLSFGYAQVGQENSFGWPAMEKGLRYQHQRLEDLRSRGLVRVETLSTSGEWFKSQYGLTPPSAIVAARDLESADRGAVWYCSRFYRTSLIWSSGSLRVRDIQLFDEDREEQYLNAVCDSWQCRYDALPVMDAFHWSNAGRDAGLLIWNNQTNSEYRLNRPPMVTERDSKTLVVNLDDAFVFTFEESSFMLCGPNEGWILQAMWGSGVQTSFRAIDGNNLLFTHEGYEYRVSVTKGRVEAIQEAYALTPDSSGILEVCFK